MPNTVSLGLPLLVAEQAQKHVTHNEALRALDALVQLSVKDRDLATPPGSPAEGDRYIVAASPTGTWAGHAADIAVWQDGAWDFHDPQEGWRCWVDDENVFLIFNGSAWVDWGAALGAIQNLSLLGVGTTADATNPFSAKLNKALWTAKTAGEGGDGDLRYTMNKENAADVLSLLLQTGFSGRAEIGLIGDDDLTFKVSADGSTFKTALVADKTTGGIRFLANQVDVASASTCDIGSAAALKVRITGTTTITSFGSVAYAFKLILFSGALTLTHNATSLILPGGANITTADGDTAIATSDGSGNWRMRAYLRANGKAIVAPTFAELSSPPTTLAGYGITDAQPLDSDLTAIAALATTNFGRSLLALSNAAGLASAAGVGSGDSPTHVALTLSNGQIAFPVTQAPSANAKTLDDYEEGTFTPTFTADTTPPTGVAYSQQVGKYTKIGNVVLYYAYIVLTNAGTGGSGPATISGLPFTCNASVNPAANTRVGAVDLNAGYTWVAGLILANRSVMYLQQQGDNVAVLTVQWSAVGNSATLLASGHYFV